MEEYIYIGKIVNTHGIKGEVRIISDFELKKRVFIKDMPIYIGRKKEREIINSYRHHKNFEMITMKGYKDINEILKYKGLYVYVKKEELELESDEYLETDLINLKVIIEDEEKGKVIEIINSGGNNKVLKIEYDNKTLMIPYQKEFINKIDLELNKIYITPIKGMFE